MSVVSLIHRVAARHAKGDLFRMDVFPDPPAKPSASEGCSDGHSFAALYEHHLALVERFLLSRGAGRDEVADLLQETLIVAWEKRELLDDGKARAFLLSTARNVLLAHKRKQRRRHALLVTEQGAVVNGLHQPRRGPDQDLNRQERLRQLSVLIAQLPPRQREVIRLTRVEGHTPAEAATMLGISPKSVYDAEGRALARLKALAREGQEA
jgi:RNA polymerase sigma factor (sigma-70 family)